MSETTSTTDAAPVAEIGLASPEQQADGERRARVRQAAALIRDGKRERALFELARSVERQHRILGNGPVRLPVCPCGTVGCQLGSANARDLWSPR